MGEIKGFWDWMERLGNWRFYILHIFWCIHYELQSRCFYMSLHSLKLLSFVIHNLAWFVPLTLFHSMDVFSFQTNSLFQFSNTPQWPSPFELLLTVPKEVFWLFIYPIFVKFRQPKLLYLLFDRNWMETFGWIPVSLSQYHLKILIFL